MSKRIGMGMSQRSQLRQLPDAKESVEPQFFSAQKTLGRYLMNYLEEVTENLHDGWYVDLFVRVGNAVAVGMYKNLGYCIYHIVEKYYASSNNIKAEDSADMRKPMKRNPEGVNASPTGKTITPKELEFH
jgi:N-terminal acetyltransferase B complex catalytic subunit